MPSEMHNVSRVDQTSGDATPTWGWPRGDSRTRAFASADVAKSEVFNAWRSYVDHSSDVTPSVPTDRFYVRSEARRFGDVVTTQLDCAPQVLQLKPAVKRLTDPETLHLRVYDGGHSQGVVGETSFVTRPGEIHAFDMARPLTNSTQGSVFTGVFLPYASVGFDPRRHAAHGQMSEKSGPGRLLAGAIRSLASTSPDLSDEELRLATEGFCALVRAVVLGNMTCLESHRAVEKARRSELRAFVEANLSDPHLSVDMICQAIGASRATIYRDFAEVGGIRTYLQQRRLVHAERELAAQPPSRGAIARCAEKWGFDSPSGFARAFRRAFGCAPGDIMGRDLSK